MLPPDRGTAWSHCVGQGDVDGPTFADTKSQARAYVSFTVIIIAASLCFIFKCPWTRTRLRAQRFAQQRGSPIAPPQPGPAVGRGRVHLLSDALRPTLSGLLIAKAQRDS